MENTYRLEYNEKQGTFHLEWDGKTWMHREGTHGWRTLTTCCTDEEFKLFEIYARSVFRSRIKKDEDYSLIDRFNVSCDEMSEAFETWVYFFNNLIDNNRTIERLT